MNDSRKSPSHKSRIAPRAAKSPAQTGAAPAIVRATRTVLTAKRLYDGAALLDDPVVVLEDGRVTFISTRAAGALPSGARILDFPGATLAPSFFDVHIHGAIGHDVMEATPEALAAMGSFLASRGVGSFLATTVTAPLDATLRAVEGLAKLMARPPAAGHARLLGIHLEGPFLSHAKRGVQPAEHLLAPDIATFDKLFNAAKGKIRLMTLAPELPGAVELTAHATRRGVRVSLGHSNATAAQTCAAIDAGAVSATHTFNAMRPAKAILVTDAISAAGMPDGKYQLGGFAVRVTQGRAMARGVLAGSVLTLDRALANFVAFTGATVEQGLRLLTANPAKMTGLGREAGSIAVGREANLVAVSAEGTLMASLVNGQPAKG